MSAARLTRVNVFVPVPRFYQRNLFFARKISEACEFQKFQRGLEIYAVFFKRISHQKYIIFVKHVHTNFCTYEWYGWLLFFFRIYVYCKYLMHGYSSRNYTKLINFVFLFIETFWVTFCFSNIPLLFNLSQKKKLCKFVFLIWLKI